MKKTLITLGFLFLPFMASAAQVQVYPTFFAPGFHGQLKFARDTTVCIQHADSSRDCATLVPTFTTPTGESYQIIFTPPLGYSYVTNDKCQGVATGEDLIICRVDYTASDALLNQQLQAAQQSTVQSQPSPSVQPQQTQTQSVTPQESFSPLLPSAPAEPTLQATQPKVAPVGKQTNGLTCSQSESILLVLSAFGVEAKTIVTVRAILEPISCI